MLASPENDTGQKMSLKAQYTTYCKGVKTSLWDLLLTYWESVITVINVPAYVAESRAHDYQWHGLAQSSVAHSNM